MRKKIEQVPENEDRHIGHYTPHRGVFKDNSTTNVRPVFDVLCKAMVGLSSNDCLSEAINRHELIPQIMLRFHLRRLGVISNIKQGFLRITVDRQDRTSCNFSGVKKPKTGR